MNRSHLALFGLCLAGCGVRVIGQLDMGEQAGAGAAGMPVAGAPSKAGAGGLPAGGFVGSGGAVTNGGGPLGGATTAGSAQAGGAQGGDAGGTDAGGEGGEDGGLPALLAVPVAHLQLDECMGADAADLESTSSPGARINVGCEKGLLGNAATFSLVPSSQRVELAEAPRFDFTHELTVAAWVRPTQSSQVGAIVGKWYGQDSFLLAIREVLDAEGHASTRFAFSIAEPEGTWGRPADVISPDKVTLGVWTHVAGVYKWSPTAGHITLYVNGEAVADASTKVGAEGLQQSVKPVTIGFVEEYAPFVGAIDEVRLYDVALGPELAWLYRDPSHP
jgi:hypothetical protein